MRRREKIMSPLTTRLLLGLTLLLAVAAGAFSLQGIVSDQKEAWATLAAALAVITSIISAWGAQRVVELEEDKLAPYPYPQFDASSRYGLLLLRITNFGGGAAHSVKIVWDKPLKDSKGQLIGFSDGSESAALSILLPGQHISKIVDGHVQFFSVGGPHVYSGLIEFRDSNGRKHSHRFFLDAESLKGTPTYDEESIKTHYELQKLPEKLDQLCKVVEKIGKQLDASDSA